MIAIISFRRGINNTDVLREFVNFMKLYVHNEIAGMLTASLAIYRFIFAHGRIIVSVDSPATFFYKLNTLRRSDLMLFSVGD